MRFVVLFAAALAAVHGCADTIDDCAYYKDAGYCTDFKDQLLEMCPKTCGFCSGGGGGDSGSGGDPGTAEDTRPARELERPELCRDTCSTKDCAWYKSQGHCELYSSVMVMNCASTCGWCGVPQCNPPEFDNGWTDFENTMIPSGATVNAYCYSGYTNWGSEQLTCNGGSLSGEARCEAVDSDSGVGEYKTACQKAAEAALQPAYENGKYVVPQESTHYVPKCDYSGQFESVQWDAKNGQTFCVDYSGMEVQGTRYNGRMEYVDCSMNSATEYYKRLEEEASYNSGSSGADSWSDGGDSWSDGGDSWSDGGDSWSDGSDSWSDGGDSWSDGGDSWSDGGDSWSDGGDSWSDGGDSWSDGGDSWSDGGDSWSDGGDSWSDGGDSWSDGGDSWSDGGNSWNDGGDSWNDGSWSDGGDSWSDGGDYYSGETDYYSGGDDSYYGGDDSYYAGDDSYYAGGDDFYYGGDDSYYYGEEDSVFDGRYYSAEGEEAEGDSFAEGAVVETIEDAIVDSVADADELMEGEAMMEDDYSSRRRNRMRNKRDAELSSE